MPKTKIIIIAFYISITITVITSAVTISYFFITGDFDNTVLEVIFFDVGQGDSVLIKSPYGQTILIDGGPDNTVMEKLGEYLPFYARDIDLVILTHPHSDHVVGLVDVLKKYRVKQVALTGLLHTSGDYMAFLQEIQKQNIERFFIDQPYTIVLGDDLVLEILYPLKNYKGKKVRNLNNTSIVAKLIYRETNFLFMGDLEEEGELELIKSSFDISAQVIKIGHHGSSTSSTEEFLHAVNPEFAVISVGKDNVFGQPSQRVLRRLKNMGVKIFRTDEIGDVVIQSDGINLWML